MNAPLPEPDFPTATPTAWMMESPPGPEILLNGQSYLYFAGTGYLGLQGHPAVLAAASAAIDRYGIHTATSRNGFGTCPPVREVELRAARLLGAEDAIYLVSGYATNFAVAAALSNRVDLVLVDEQSHDSLGEATRWLTQLKQPPLMFHHRDAGHVEQLLQMHLRPTWRPLVMADGVFAASGALSPLADYLAILARYDNAMLHVDDAHGLAVLGEHGCGSLELAGIPPDAINRDPEEPAVAPRVFHATTLSKAVGGHGGVIAGSHSFLDRVRHSSGWFKGSSAPAAAVAAATAKGLELIESEPALRHKLNANVSESRSALSSLGLEVEQSPSPVIGIRLDTADRMQRVQRNLVARGIVVSYARNYAGAGPDGMLRVAVFATHTLEMIARLVDGMRQALGEETAS